MERSLAAKLHDILKLTGDSKMHFCPERCAEFKLIKDADLKNALKHHCVSRHWTTDHREAGCNPYPLTPEMLCIHLADVKAATISRKLRKPRKEGNYHKTFRIWRDARKTKEELEKDKKEVSADPDVIKKVIAATDLSKLYDEFQDAFNARSEDAAQCPFASLQTHNELTAAWFEFFLKNAEHFGISDEMPDAKTLRKRKYEFSKKLLALIRIKLTVNSKLARLRDSKIIKDVPEILQSLRQAVNGVTIYDLSDEVLVAAIPGEAENFPEKVRAVLGQRTNYYVETTVVNSILSNKEFLHTFNKLFVPYEMNLYPAIQDEITTIEGNEASHKAIICDMCQMAQARHLYPRDAYPGSTEIEPIEESLCDGCFDVRKDADKAKNLAKWEDEENVSAAFFKVHIDMAGLTAFLKKMFKDVFLKDEILDDDLGFSIIKEFLHDYKRFLAAFKDEVLWHEDYGKSENHERIMDDLFCIKVKKAGDIKPLVRCYTEMLESNQFFSSMAKFGAARRMVMPIRLSVTVSSVKYPFMESWRRLNEPNEEINIYAIPNVKLEVRLAKFKRLMDSGIEKKRVSAALHKLAEIEDRTDNQFLTKVAMLDMKGDLEDLAIPLITTGELSLKETLAFYKIMKGAEKR